jgi:hypothetical protein
VKWKLVVSKFGVYQVDGFTESGALAPGAEVNFD